MCVSRKARYSSEDGEICDVHSLCVSRKARYRIVLAFEYTRVCTVEPLSIGHLGTDRGPCPL